MKEWGRKEKVSCKWLEHIQEKKNRNFTITEKYIKASVFNLINYLKLKLIPILAKIRVQGHIHTIHEERALFCIHVVYVLNIC